MFKKILIANRGEIACRVMKTARELGIKTVAVYSDADTHAMHVQMADEAHHIGPSPASDSYLDHARILAIAKQSGAEAIHPGYGFLSENAGFAEDCEKAGIIFIGPPAAAIRAMGSKSVAKRRMEKAKVPMLPGYHGDKQDEKTLLDAAKKIGFPVLLKAAAGGGGKGMRRIDHEKDFSAAFAATKREALKSFADDTLLIEKYLTSPRHVEMQVFSDTHGNHVYLFERDCSIQRRHQKILEEAPAPNLDNAIQTRMGEVAVDAAKAIDYVGAGTIEFLLDVDQQFYFMEMNTRLQVEHPVTEMTTKQDLVAWQLHVAAGNPLPCTQAELTQHGHAIEVRLYAEDPANQFLPSTGELALFHVPSHDPHVRLDTGVQTGDHITPFYDPMIAKLIVWGNDRHDAITRMQQTLAETHIVGVKNNVALLRRIVAHPDFANAKLSTHFIDMHQDTLMPAPTPMPADCICLAAVATICQQQDVAIAASDPWAASDAWQSHLPATQILRFEHDGKTLQAMIEFQADNLHCTVSHSETDKTQAFSVTNMRLNGQQLHLTINQQPTTAWVVENQDTLVIIHQGESFTLMRWSANHAHTDSNADASLLAPMPGTVAAVMVKVGEQVASGQPLMILEAMKMEHTITAPHEGTVEDVCYNIGDQVNDGAVLLSLEATT
ncbi:MAG: 3-methylcrotonyl-CoA carboxylase subunit alpha [marine bacterium B5-7]|nr:MAG: 3-methylcrotonyl-CoA carboxylase subunit alpha [marine bacterium B5-7]